MSKNRVGLDTSPAVPRLTFPMFDVVGRLVAIKYRASKPRAQMLAPSGKGREWPLYPWPNRNDGAPLLVCGGELDALCALSVGLPACSITLGVDCWLDAWTPLIARRRVVIAFDVGELRQARVLRRKLTALGVQARVLDLRRLGVRAPKGDVSDYLLGGGEPDRLLRGGSNE